MFGLSLWGKRTVGLANKGEELETGVPAAWRFHLLLSSSPASPLHPSLQLFPPPTPHPAPIHKLCCSFSLEPGSPEEVTPHTHTHSCCVLPVGT